MFRDLKMHLELRFFPYGTMRRQILRKLLGLHTIVPTHMPAQTCLTEWEAFRLAHTKKACVVLVSGMKFSEDSGQTTFHYAIQCAAQGLSVVFVYSRSPLEAAQAQDPNHKNIFLMPIDEASKLSNIFSSFEQSQSLFLTMYPAPETHMLMGNAKGAKWRTMYLALDDWSAFHRDGLAPWYSKTFEEFVCANVGAAAAINEYLKLRLQSYCAHDVAVIANGLKIGIEHVQERLHLERGDVTLGFFGSLEPEWFDWDLLCELAKRNPSWRIYIIGSHKHIPTSLPANLHCLGRIAQRLLASYAVHWDVGLVPFRCGSIAEGADPIKIYEYLAMGLPVVVQGVVPPIGSEEYVTRADSLLAFEAACQIAASEKQTTSVQRRRNYAYTCSWESRCRDLLQFAQYRTDPILSTPLLIERKQVDRWLFAYPMATYGGIETVIKARIAALQNAGIEAHVWFLQDMGGADLYREFSNRCHTGSLEALRQHLHQQNYDFVSVIDSHSILEVVTSERKRIGDIAFEFHTPYPEHCKNLHRLSASMIQKIIVPSEFQAKICRKIVGDQFSVHVVTNSLSEEFLTPVQTEETYSPLRKEGSLLTWVGRLEFLKNWQGFIKIAEAVHRERPDIRFCMVAHGTPQQELEFSNYLAVSKIARKLMRYRNLHPSDMPEIYNATQKSGGLVCSTSFLESFGMSVAEGMARGCPALVPEESAMTDFVCDNVTGLIYKQRKYEDAASRIIALTDRPEMQMRIGMAAAAHIQRRFSSEQMLHELLDVASKRNVMGAMNYLETQESLPSATVIKVPSSIAQSRIDL